jgi:prevent-host-death family protein
MPRMAVLPQRPLSEAKAKLSDVMTEVVHRHQPVLVDRHRGKETMLLMDTESLRPLLAHFRFETHTRFEDGEWTLFSPELNLFATDADFDAALDELVEVAESYAADFFARHDFYMQTDRAAHQPWLLRLAITDDHESRRQLFIEPPEHVRGARPVA